MKKICLSGVMALLAGLLLAFPAAAADTDDVAYFVASDEMFNQVTGIRSYLTNDGVKVVHINAANMEKLKNVRRYVVFGSPDDTDAIGELIRKSLKEKELANARKMGKAALVSTEVAGKQVLFFATSFSMKSLVSAASASWQEYFESWYDVRIPITQIIGY